jgi:hypothetical protein
VGEFGVLLARDHGELDRLIITLVTEDRGSSVWRQALEAARLGFAAHVEAQERAHLLAGPGQARLIAYVTAAHRVQEQLFDRLSDERRPLSLVATDALELRSSLLSHDEQERLIVLPALRDEMGRAAYARVAPTYATERLHALGALFKVAPRPRRPSTLDADVQ